MFSSGPIQVSNDITDFSLRESIGGFVTWANFCLQLSYSDLIFLLIGDIGVSSPIEPVGSLLSIA